MPWIKRNLYFVITVVVGLGLTGYCGYLFYASLADTAKASDDYATAVNSLDALQKKVPYPSKENIEVAEADAVRVRNFKAEFRKPFSGFPVPPKLDDRQFKDYLQKTINQFTTEATNAGVGIPPGFAFGFSQQIDKLNFPSDSIEPWLQEMEEIKAILHIFYNAKINYLQQIKRPQVSPDDNSFEIIQFPTNTQPWGSISPYMVDFRAFSTEIANVLAGIASSSNCFIVQAIYVSPSREPLQTVTDVEQEAPPPQPQYTTRRNPYTTDPSGQRIRRQRRQSMDTDESQEPPAGTVPANGPPATILTETPLFVTIYINVVKLKAETPPPAPAPTSGTRRRTTEHTTEH